MPMVDFYFNGWIRGAEVTEALDAAGNKVNVTNLTVYELALALNRGELTIDLKPYIDNHVEAKIDLNSFNASRYRPREESRLICEVCGTYEGTPHRDNCPLKD